MFYCNNPDLSYTNYTALKNVVLCLQFEETHTDYINVMNIFKERPSLVQSE